MSVLSRRARTEQTRRTNEDALLQATVTLLEDGSAFADLGIERIVKRAGLSRPTFYTYFKDKRDLALRLGATIEGELATATDPWLATGDIPARDTIVAVHGLFARHHAALRAITEAATYDPDVAAYWQAFHDRFLPATKRRIAAGYPDLDDDATTARAYTLLYMTERTLIEHLNRPLVGDAAIIDQLTWFWERAVNQP